MDLLRGKDVAKRLQLMLNFDLTPPFCSGQPSVADGETVAAVKTMAQGMLVRRRRGVEAERPLGKGCRSAVSASFMPRGARAESSVRRR